MTNRFKKLIKENQRRVHLSQLYWLLAIMVFALVFISCKTETSENNLADIHGPDVTSCNPEPNSIDFPIADSISVTFIENIENSLDSQQCFTLTDGSNRIQGNVVITDQTLTFTPNSPLEKTTTYTATIDGEIKDTSGNRMAHDYTWSFESTQHPTLSSTNPATGAQNIAINSSITATFSEVMNASTINTSTFTLANASAAVSGSVSYSNFTATFSPNSNLDASTDYTATITTGVQDLAGNSMENPYSWSFTTVESQSSYSFENGAIPFSFTMSGDAGWLIDNSGANGTSYSMKSGDITDSQTSCVEFNELTNGYISFYYKTSTESGYDYLRFYVDGTSQASWSGERDWTQVNYSFSAGEHAIKWCYDKDSIVSSGSDTVWVDEILFDNTDLYDNGELWRSFSPTTVEPGITMLDISTEIVNGGIISSGPFVVNFYASSDTTIDSSSDYYIGSSTMSGITGGNWANCDWSGIFPASVPDGTYHVGWIIDANGQIAETNENNNNAYKAGYQLTVQPPSNQIDLYDDGESNRSFSPMTVEPGVTVFNISTNVRNGGTDPSETFVVKFYASTDTTISTSDNLISSKTMSSIAGGSSANCDWSGTFPDSIPDGTYYVGWIIDADGQVAETDENNNKAYKTGYQLTAQSVQMIDLSISSSPSEISEGNSATYTTTASYSDGSSQIVTPDWTEYSSYASVNNSGTVTTSYVLSNQTFTLIASYNGYSDYKTITIKDVILTFDSTMQNTSTYIDTSITNQTPDDSRASLAIMVSDTSFNGYLYFGYLYWGDICDFVGPSYKIRSTILYIITNYRDSSGQVNIFDSICTYPENQTWNSLNCKGSLGFTFYTSPIVSFSPENNGNTTSVDITSLTSNWLNSCSSNKGLVLAPASGFFQFGSKEGSQPSRITIQYSNDP